MVINKHNIISQSEPDGLATVDESCRQTGHRCYGGKNYANYTCIEVTFCSECTYNAGVFLVDICFSHGPITCVIVSMCMRNIHYSCLQQS